MSFLFNFDSSRKKVSLKGKDEEEKSRDEFLSSVRSNREETKLQKAQTRSATTIQKNFRKHLIRKSVKIAQRKEFDHFIMTSKCNFV